MKDITQEDKDLLLKDLCARLSYKIKVRYSSYKEFITCTLHSINPIYNTVDLWNKNACFSPVCISKIKPYLFPLSSMTEEQKKEFKEISKCKGEIRNYGGFDSEGVYLVEIGKYEYEYDIDTTVEEFYFNGEIIDWFNKNHFDYRGLIERGLAIDATGKNIY